MAIAKNTEQPTASASRGPQIICPECGGVNPSNAIFCANKECHKALGGFKYVEEELRAESRWHETLAQRVTDFIGRPQFIALHALVFVAWLAINTGLVAFFTRFDEYPFGLLAFILTVEAIFLTSFILITNNRQSAHANKQAELDYEVSVLTYRAIEELRNSMTNLASRLEAMESNR